jgi:hypothetical protein
LYGHLWGSFLGKKAAGGLFQAMPGELRRSRGALDPHHRRLKGNLRQWDAIDILNEELY